MPRAPYTPRPISGAERAVLTRALEVCPSSPLAKALSDTVAALQVVSTCGCGCDTVEFDCTRLPDPPSVIADGVALTPEGESIGILVFGYDHGITCLEVYNFDDVPARLPTLESIRSFENTTPTSTAV
jgi:hypothetical protein